MAGIIATSALYPTTVVLYEINSEFFGTWVREDIEMKQ